MLCTLLCHGMGGDRVAWEGGGGNPTTIPLIHAHNLVYYVYVAAYYLLHTLAYALSHKETCEVKEVDGINNHIKH